MSDSDQEAQYISGFEDDYASDESAEILAKLYPKGNSSESKSSQPDDVNFK